MKILKVLNVNIYLIFSTVILILLSIFLPIENLEYLSINVVGEPPINGESWTAGVASLGGESSMRILAIIGICIIFLVLSMFFRRSNIEIKEYAVKNSEILIFFVITILFFITNLLIGYKWWDPDGVLGMGPLFIPSLISLVFLGISPNIFNYLKNKGNNKSVFFNSRKNFWTNAIYMLIFAYGYGLVSLIWHCCSFYESKMYFFFFITKLIQLWGMCSFFYKWGLSLLTNYFGNQSVGKILTSFLFGICYPWHTFGFAIVFIVFGYILSEITIKTNTYLTGMMLLYFSYIFHASLAWNGPDITFIAIYPISITILMTILYRYTIQLTNRGNKNGKK